MTFTFAFWQVVVSRIRICIFVRIRICICTRIWFGTKGRLPVAFVASQPSCNSWQHQQLTCNQNAKKNICYLHNTLAQVGRKYAGDFLPNPILPNRFRWEAFQVFGANNWWLFWWITICRRTSRRVNTKNPNRGECAWGLSTEIKYSLFSLLITIV